MKRLKPVIFTAVSTIAVIAAVVIMILIFNSIENTSQVLWPELPDISGTKPPDGQGGSSSDNSLMSAVVNADTVQTVIRTLKRPESYVKRFSAERFWDNGSTVYSITAYVLPDKTKLIIEHAGFDKRSIIITEEKLYSWYEGSASYYEGNRWQEESVLETADAFQLAPTYEDILTLKKEDILFAEYRETEGGWYIYVEAADAVLGYLMSYYISIESGLLEKMEISDGGNPIQKLTASSFELTPPDEREFTLPNGRRV